MTTSILRSAPSGLPSHAGSPDHRMAAALARLLIAAVAVLVPLALVLAGMQSAHRAGAAAVRVALVSITAALKAEHTVTGEWPADLVAVGTAVSDAGGHRIATIPAGVAVDYQRSIDHRRVVVTVTDRDASAAFDSATAAR
jgi:uncharacterized membrane protein